MEKPRKPDPFEYFEYSEYLNDYFNYKKKTEPGFTYRKFMKAAGISGTAYLNRIIHGTRKLSGKYISNVLKVLAFNQKQEQYFHKLVLYCNEKRPLQKNKHLKDLLKLRAAQPEFKLRDRKLKFFQKWYYPVVRELVTQVDFQEDYNLLSRMLIPPISPVQAKSAVKYLVENKFIVKEAGGRYSLIDTFITTGPKVNSTILTQYHHKNLEINLEIFESPAAGERGVSSLTLSVSEKGYERLREEITLFRKRLMQVVREDSDPDRVAHVGFQLVPRAVAKKGKAS